jgi:hypothetical protein
MNNGDKEVYSLLQDIFKNIWEQQKYAELKNGLLITLHVAFIIMISRVYLYYSDLINDTNTSQIIFTFLIAIFTLHLFKIIQSFFPKTSNLESVKVDSDNNINIFYFGDICKLNSKSFLNIVNKKLNKNQENESYLKDLANQIVIISAITNYKYNSFKISIIRMYFVLISFFIYFITI